jgi:hypothetical protein
VLGQPRNLSYSDFRFVDTLLCSEALLELNASESALVPY